MCPQDKLIRLKITLSRFFSLVDLPTCSAFSTVEQDRINEAALQQSDAWLLTGWPGVGFGAEGHLTLCFGSSDVQSLIPASKKHKAIVVDLWV